MEGLLALGGFSGSHSCGNGLPGLSEAALVGLQLGRYLIVLLVSVASLGNVLGAVVTRTLGRGVEPFRDRRWFPVLSLRSTAPARGTASVAGGACCCRGRLWAVTR